MAGRLAIGVAMAACFLTTGGLYAQGPASAAGPTTVAPNPYYGSPAYPPSSYGPAAYGPASGGSWSGNYAAGNGDAAPGGYPPQAGPCGYMPRAAYASQTGPGASPPNPYVDCNGMATTSDTRDSEQLDETPLEEALCRAARNVIFNIDYINWGIVKPQTELIGAQPTLATLNPGLINLPSEFYPFFSGIQKTPTQPFPVDNGFARAYDTGPISLYENSGIKGTLSLPMTFGSAELTGFILQHAESQVNLGGLPQGSAFNTPPDEFFAGIPVKVNEMNSSLVALYNQSFGAEFTTLVFGGEFNIVFNPIVPKEYGLLIRPMLGFRYLGIQEEFDVDASNAGAATTTIKSRTINNIYGPQIGCRFELVTQWFTIGAEPRVMVGVNQFVSTVDSFDPTIGSSSDRISTVRFTPVGAFDLYAKIPIHDQVKLYFAYNLIGTGNISRPQQQIDYNVDEVNGVFTNDLHLSLAHSEFIVQGFSAGLEFNF
jgi:hypothetical protein